MPDMDLQTSLTLLIAAALTGGFLIIWLAFFLVYPGLVFGLWVKDDKFTVKQLVLARLIWFVLPMAVFSGLVFLSFKWFTSYVLLAVIASAIVTACFISCYVVTLMVTGKRRSAYYSISQSQPSVF
jgi:hypothetical protein